MAKLILGGNGPTINLFHYGAAPRAPIRSRSYWTDFDSMNKADVSRITGQAAIYFTHRTVVLVNHNILDMYFDNVATVMKPGLPACFEYRNKAEVPMIYLDTIAMP